MCHQSHQRGLRSSLIVRDLLSAMGRRGERGWKGTRKREREMRRTPIHPTWR